MSSRKISKSNLIASLVLLAAGFAIVSVWYFLHPSSPYRQRSDYVIRFKSIGSLSEGNLVRIDGLKYGKVFRIDIDEKNFFVTIRILASVKIPVNSSIRLVNAGFLGERQVAFTLGDAQRYFAPGDTLSGIYDQGTVGITDNLSACTSMIKNISDTAKSLSDTLFHGSNGKAIGRVQKKWARLVSKASKATSEWKSEARNSLDNLSAAADKAGNTLDEASRSFKIVASKADSLKNHIDTLQKSIDSLHQKVDNIKEKLDADDNTLALTLSQESELSSQIKGLQQDTKNLIKDIKKSGIHLNVDIF